MVKWLLLLALSACTLSNPFGVECVSDVNCGCANCCIGYRCVAVGTQALDAGSTVDAGRELVGQVTTLAGGSRGMTDGTGAQAQFDAPTALALDVNGLLYVLDSNNQCIRTVDGQGVVTTAFPNLFPCGGTGLDAPGGLAFGSDGTLYVSDTGRNCVRAVSATGTASVVGGSCSRNSSDCLSSPPRFAQPAGLAFAPPFLFVTETGANRVRWIHLQNGTVGTLSGQGFGTAILADGVCSFSASCSGSVAGATFNGPAGIAVGAPGELFVTDAYNCALRRLTWEPGCTVQTVGRSRCPMFASEDTSGILRNPFAVTAGLGPLAGSTVVADTGNHRIATVSPAGLLSVLAGSRQRGAVDGVGAEAQFSSPAGIVVDGAGRLFVADTGNNRIRVLTPVMR
ncbi:MAG: hypothetical protein SFW67_37215 [Myxococcaceae bacterium]|nr:hypothetical protein [Myxococcaceae bacterium]